MVGPFPCLRKPFLPPRSRSLTPTLAHGLVTKHCVAGYTRAASPDAVAGFDGPYVLEGAIEAPQDTYMGTRQFPLADFQKINATLCAQVCLATNRWSEENPDVDVSPRTCVRLHSLASLLALGPTLSHRRPLSRPAALLLRILPFLRTLRLLRAIMSPSHANIKPSDSSTCTPRPWAPTRSSSNAPCSASRTAWTRTRTQARPVAGHSCSSSGATAISCREASCSDPLDLRRRAIPWRHPQRPRISCSLRRPIRRS